MDTKRTSNPASLPLRILLIEDHQDSREMMRAFLSSQGHAVISVGSCAEAARATPPRDIQGHRGFDLILGDISLPDGDGVALLAECKSLYGCPAIAITGRALLEVGKCLIDAGIEQHVLKPVKFGELQAAIAKVTGLKRRD